MDTPKEISGFIQLKILTLSVNIPDDCKIFGKNKDEKPGEIENSIGAPGGSRSEHFTKTNHNPKGKKF